MSLMLVKNLPAPHQKGHRLLVLGRDGRSSTVASFEERAIRVPLISLLLGTYCRMGAMIDAGPDYGLQVSAQLNVLYRGARVSLVGALVPLVGYASLVLPLGLLE